MPRFLSVPINAPERGTIKQIGDFFFDFLRFSKVFFVGRAVSTRKSRLVPVFPRGDADEAGKTVFIRQRPARKRTRAE